MTDGKIDNVSLAKPDGGTVAGQLSSDKASWSTSEPLGYGKTYTWHGTATGTDNKPVEVSGSFTTATPKRQISGSLNVGDGQTYGIAMPIAITFSSKVTDKAAVERRLSVETTPKTEGSWAWLSDTSAHWRPKDYYQPNTQVKVTANIYGVNMGNGVFGKSDVTAGFTIRRSQIGISKITHVDELVFRVQRNSVRIFQQSVVSFDSPNGFISAGRFLAVNHDGSVLIGHVEQTRFLVSRNPESADSVMIPLGLCVAFCIRSKDGDVALSVIVHDVDFAGLRIDIYPAHHFRTGVRARNDAFGFRESGLDRRVLVRVVFQDLK